MIPANERRDVERKVLKHLAGMPPLKAVGKNGEAFNKRWKRNREGNMKREEFNAAAENEKDDDDDDDADDWEDRDDMDDGDVGQEPAREEVAGGSELDERMAADFRKLRSTKTYSCMLEFRKKLPAFNKRAELLDLVARNQVIVVSGETGCGKTTQVPQFILDDALERGMGSRCRIVCTQPRRISAISIAERVADERGERCGGGVSSIGYQIRHGI
jgi:HrpA-like RNA helicase